MVELVGKYTTARIYADTIEDGVYSQVYDIINCPASKGQTVVCMPDVHVGKTGPCGLVMTIGEYVCPDHIGVDIGCSVSMMILDKKIPSDKFPEFEHRIKKLIPFGTNIHDKSVVDDRDLYRFLTNGCRRYAVMWPEMLGGLPTLVTEKWVSDMLCRIGMEESVFYKSLGSVGGGNHYIEYDESDEFGGINLHFGSRNFGVKVCRYWMNRTNGTISNKDKKLIADRFRKEYRGDIKNFSVALDEHLSSLNKNHIRGYLSGEDMKGYLCDMVIAQLYAEYNHRTVQRIISDILHKYGIKVVETIASVHNYIDYRDHVLRKSAIKSYVGETILIPFNMRDGIAICEGKSNKEWLNSCSHGAGRKMSRAKAKSHISFDEFKESMDGIYSTTVCRGTIDESPMAYKDTNEIVELIKETCEVKYMMRPKINIKSTCGDD